MVRKLDKIEKEMGYCEIKLEKERRLRRQLEYLRADLEVLGSFVRLYEGREREIARLPFPKIGRQIAIERQHRTQPGPFFLRSRDDFIAAGVLELVDQERDVLQREIEDIEGRFENFLGFREKRAVLEQEKEQALDRFGSTSSVRQIDEAFKKTERLWNALTEDAIHLDEALFHLARNVDYVNSARAFLIAAKGSFDIENWVESGCVGELFRHSNVARSKEMFEGANRNLKLAHKELVSMSNLRFDIEGFEPVLVHFLEALFDDIFLDGRIERTVTIADEAIEEAERRLEGARAKREQLHEKLEQTEATRGDLFQKLGDDQTSRRVVVG